MDDQVLADCAALLNRDELEVEHLFDQAELLPALLARIGLLLVAERKGAPLRGAGQAWCAAVLAGWGTSGFMARDLIVWAERGATPQHRDVLAASRELCRLGGDAGLSPQGLGTALGALVDAPGQLRVYVINERRRTKVWAVRDLRG